MWKPANLRGHVSAGQGIVRPGSPGDGAARPAVRSMICRGLRDRILDPDYLDAWRGFPPHAIVHAIPDAGHYVLEDA